MHPSAEPQAWIDISVPIRTGMVHWPGDEPVICELREKKRADGGVSRVSRLSFGSHCGTHVDAPYHFDVGDLGVDALPFDALIGVARVVSIEDDAAVHRTELEALGIQRGERLLFRTRNSLRCWATDEFVHDYVYVTPDAATFHVERGVRTVGVDYLSVGGRVDGAITHRVLLEAGVCIVEGLDLSRVTPGEYDFVALPLRISGGDGAPARAALRPRVIPP
jgi:arylformamidase